MIQVTIKGYAKNLYNIKRAIYMMTVRGEKKRVKEISRKETTYPFELISSAKWPLLISSTNHRWYFQTSFQTTLCLHSQNRDIVSPKTEWQEQNHKLNWLIKCYCPCTIQNLQHCICSLAQVKTTKIYLTWLEIE